MLGLRLWSCQVAWEQWNVLAWEEGQEGPDLVHFIEVENPRIHGQWSEEMVWLTLGWAVVRVVRMLCKTNPTRASIFWTDFSLLTWTGIPWSVCSLDQQYQHHNLLGMCLPRVPRNCGFLALILRISNASILFRSVRNLKTNQHDIRAHYVYFIENGCPRVGGWKKTAIRAQ